MIYVVGNIPGARDANDPDVNWRPDVDTSDCMHDVRTEEITASTDVSCVVTTRANKIEKHMKPLHVVKSREVEIDSNELQQLQENDLSLNKIAHESIIGGHLGGKNTLDRVMSDL